jgi:hypothetical protein
VCYAIWYEDLSDIILVGHSMQRSNPEGLSRLLLELFPSEVPRSFAAR